MSKINNFEFYQTSLLGTDAIVVRDLDCLMEEVYRLGTRRYLDTDSLADENEAGKVLITNFDQVKEAWLSGKIWF